MAWGSQTHQTSPMNGSRILRWYRIWESPSLRDLVGGGYPPRAADIERKDPSDQEESTSLYYSFIHSFIN